MGLLERGSPLYGSFLGEPGGGSFSGALKVMKVGSGDGHLHGGSVGQPGVGARTGNFEIWLKGVLGVESLSLSLSLSLCGSSVKGTWREGSFAGDPEGRVEKAMETGNSSHRGPNLGNLGEGSSTGNFERWMKGARWIKCLCL
jgi:hypothetical protein